MDVGGGGGHCIASIFKAHPVLPPEEFVLQDLHDSIIHARNGDSLPKEVVTMEHDFMKEQLVKDWRFHLEVAEADFF